MELFKSKFGLFARNEAGTTTVEFMIAMPLIIFWVAGSFTFFNAFATYSKSVKATYTVADIISRQHDIDNTYIENMNLLFANFMNESTNDVWLRVSSIEKNGDNFVVGWSTATGMHNALTTTADIPVEIIPDLLDAESIVLVESFMSFSPFLDYVGIDSRTYSNRIAVTPRWVSPMNNTDS